MMKWKSKLKSCLVVWFSLFLFCGKLSFAQDTYPYERASFELIGSQKNFSDIPFLSRSSAFLKTPPKYVGIQFSGNYFITENHTLFRKDRYNYFHESFSQLLPMDVKVGDSINAKMTGYNLGFSLWGYDLFLKKRNIDLAITIGANTGRLRLYGNRSVQSQNTYFSPKARLSAKVFIGKIAITASAEYEHDVTSGKWTKLWLFKPNTEVPYGFYQSGFTFSLGIGLESTEKK